MCVADLLTLVIVSAGLYTNGLNSSDDDDESDDDDYDDDDEPFQYAENSTRPRLKTGE